LYASHLSVFTNHHLFYFSTFFFCTSFHHRDLHSFPTRRSSDLGTCNDSKDASRWIFLMPSVKNERASPARFTRRRAGDARSFFTDRKSTRLNSSHVSISYAVFCLKKKKKNRIARNL